MKSAVESELRRHFRPEFLNRIDDIVIFRRLELEDIERIVDLQMARVADMLRGRGVSLAWTDSARSWLARAAFDPVYGARPLRRNIQKLIQDPLALRLLAGEVGDGSSVNLVISPDGERLEFEIRGEDKSRRA
jgi:ATP-dependent Clp protease ATP-binding subunit ClpB